MTGKEHGSKRPWVGVAVIALRAGKVLPGLRRGAHGSGQWAFPGGHLEYGEGVLDCARRELWEETGLVAENPRPGPYTNDVFVEEERHYITLFVLCGAEGGEPVVKEPEKCERWGWFSWDALPRPRFLSLQTLADTGFVPCRAFLSKRGAPQVCDSSSPQ
jgi:8-oxo-dGTP diphosphatase